MAPKDLRKIRMPSSLLVRRSENPMADNSRTPVPVPVPAAPAPVPTSPPVAAPTVADAAPEPAAKSAPAAKGGKGSSAKQTVKADKAVPSTQTPAPASTAQAALPIQPEKSDLPGKVPLGNATTQLRYTGRMASRFSERFTAPALPEATKPYGRNLWLFIWLIIVMAAAQATLFIQPLVGVYVNAAVFGSLMLLALQQERARHLIIAVAIIPLTMLVSLSLPQSTVFMRTTNFMVIILLLGLIYQYIFTLDYPLEGTRLRMTRHGYLFAIPLMVVFGQLLGLIGFGLLHNQYDFRDTSLALVAVGAVIFAIAEEVLFRGLIQQRAMLLFHPIVAAILSAALYAGLTFGHRGGIFSPVFGALLGISLAVVYYKKQNILLTITINAATKLTYVGLVAIFVLRN